jgi:hypothetical protein
MTSIPRSNAPTVYGPPSFDVMVHFTQAAWREHVSESADVAEYGSADFTGAVGHTRAHNLNLPVDSEFDPQEKPQC